MNFKYTDNNLFLGLFLNYLNFEALQYNMTHVHNMVNYFMKNDIR